MEIEIMDPEWEARYRATPVTERSTASSVLELAKEMARQYDVEPVELSADGTVGTWACYGMLSVDDESQVLARLIDGVVYWDTI